MHIEQYLTMTVFYHDYCNEQYNGVRTRPPPEISPGAWSPITEPSALELGGLGNGPPRIVRSKSLHALKTYNTIQLNK